MIPPEIDTENKIKAAAERIFVAHGYDGATIRQIAQEADVNVALVNYYFRSKEQLFKSIYKESFVAFFGKMIAMLDEKTPIEVKIWKLVDRYIDFLLDNPLIPSFLLTQLRGDETTLFHELNIREKVHSVYFTRQLQEEIDKGNIRKIHPLQVIFTVMSNIVFPFMAHRVISYIGDMDEKGFRQFIAERKIIIPEMVMTYLKQP